ncbi:Dopamine receptor 1 [Melipona quadrifasciata]|uniref:Dopamine receptor 1 n=1 Tax=Melipona quadrifasciata TaxID=166423 RepID=A0A0N0BDA3_9HYME|nr:Dopamine receptor 1 [Melipona quadrifasciata]
MFKYVEHGNLKFIIRIYYHFYCTTLQSIFPMQILFSRAQEEEDRFADCESEKLNNVKLEVKVPSSVYYSFFNQASTCDTVKSQDCPAYNNLTDGEEDLPEDAFSLLSVLLVANTIDPPLAQFVRPILSGFLFLVLIFLSVAGNILVCVAIYTDRGLRRIGNLFLASLAIADLFVGCLVMTFAGVNDLLGYWVFGPRFCDTWIAFDVMCSTASILNLCAISLDRYIHIKDPLRYGRWVTRRVAVAGIAIVWLLAGLISFVPISLGLHRREDEPEHPTCALDLTPTYAIVSSSISFYVPCIVMLGIYCRLYCYAQKHVKSIRAVTKLPDTSMAKSFRAKSTRNKPPKPQTKTKPTSPYHVSDHKAAITVVFRVFRIHDIDEIQAMRYDLRPRFATFEFPFLELKKNTQGYSSRVGLSLSKVLTWLGYSNSAFNPIIYSIFNTEFREAFKRILTKGANVSPKLLRNPSNLTQICVTYLSEKNPCEMQPTLIESLPSSISAIHNVYYIPTNEKLHSGYHN